VGNVGPRSVSPGDRIVRGNSMTRFEVLAHVDQAAFLALNSAVIEPPSMVELYAVRVYS
jgi:hypothetical protein